MQEYSVPPNVSLSPTSNLTEPVWQHEQQHPSRVAIQRFVNGSWVDMTSGDFAAHVRSVAKGLIASGVKAGDRVAIFADTRFDWTLADYAIMAAGAATVPIYPSSSEEQVEWILSDSGAVGVFCAGTALEAIVGSVRDALPDLAHVWSFDGGALEQLHALRALGVRVALDDFGTGYSSLAYLRRFPFDTLKIDRTFINEMLQRDDSQAIVRMMTQLAGTLGMRTVAEGVETEAQLSAVAAAGCDEVQGFLVSRPCTLTQLQAMREHWQQVGSFAHVSLQ